MNQDLEHLYIRYGITDTYCIKQIEHIYKSYIYKKYGCFKMERTYSPECYLIYGFRNSDCNWYFLQCDFLEIMTDRNVIKILKIVLPIILPDEQYCTSCFHDKILVNDIEHLRKDYVWCKTPKVLTNAIQKELLTFGTISWACIKNIDVGGLIVYAKCANHESNEVIQEKGKLIKKIVYKNIAEYIMSEAPEQFLESFICEHLYLIEEGLEFTDRQLRIEDGFIDIHAYDKNRIPCIIELKVVNNSKDVVYQAAYYQSIYKSEVRVIIIAPGYTKSIYRALRRIDNVETYYYHLDGEEMLRIDRYMAEEAITKVN